MASRLLRVNLKSDYYSKINFDKGIIEKNHKQIRL